MVVALCSFVTFAASEYMVYNFSMVANTTVGKGKTTTSCGDSYVWRTAMTQRIKGIIAGCGCQSILADGSCENALVLLWNETTKTQITNFTFSTWVVQRIGKTGEKAEHIAVIKCDDFEITLGGFGQYKNDHVTVSGMAAGVATAPVFTTLGKCNACAIEPDSTDQTVALAPCKNGVCEASANADITPFAGRYTLKYNSILSKTVSKNGISSNTLKTPVYVDINKGFFD